MKIYRGALLLLLVASCRPEPVPRPKGYFRIDLADQSYATYTSACRFEMQVPVQSKIEKIMESGDSCWFNLWYPRHKARLHFTATPIQGNFDKLMSDSYELALKHEMKASAINRTPVQRPMDKVWGLIYDIKGEAASPLQFYLTDSTRYFVRASLYFSHKPNPDSIAPVLDYIRHDVEHLCNTLIWKAP